MGVAAVTEEAKSAKNAASSDDGTEENEQKIEEEMRRWSVP